MTEKQQQEFKSLCNPLIAWLNKNGNPHETIRIDTTSAELLQGVIGFYNDEYVVD
jgi:hypothetical protein